MCVVTCPRIEGVTKDSNCYCSLPSDAEGAPAVAHGTVGR